MSDTEKRMYEITQLSESYPTGLKTVDEIAGAATLPAERIMDYAQAGFIPHYRIDGGEFLFKPSEVKKWIAENLMMRCGGEKLPYNIIVSVANSDIYQDAPLAIANLPNLSQMPKYGLTSGVYFLCDGSEVVYVGQSVCPASRVATHVRDDHKDFDRCYVMTVPIANLNNVEGAFIKTLKPKYNFSTAHERLVIPPMTMDAKEVIEGKLGVKLHEIGV